MVYFDNAATTRLYDEVVEVLAKASVDYFANPSSVHSPGSRAKARLEDARDHISHMLGAKKNEIYFTSGATESINWAMKGLGLAVILGQGDHKASLMAAGQIGHGSHVLPLGEGGQVDLNALENINEDKALLSLTLANNETGIIQDLEKPIDLARSKAYFVHVDSVQALGKMDLNIGDLGVDLLSLSSHKIHGPKGLGILYIREGLEICPLINGGGQESSLRSGTENLPAILAFEKALEITLEDLESKIAYTRDLRDLMEEEILRELPHTRINGKDQKRLPSISNMSFKGLDSSQILMLLDMKGYQLSAGSACSSGAIEKSHVLKAMGLEDDYIKGSIRASLDPSNTREEVLAFVDCLRQTIRSLRAKA